jgi:hypothetical protein
MPDNAELDFDSDRRELLHTAGPLARSFVVFVLSRKA